MVLEWGRHPSLIPLSSLELEGDWWAKMLANSHKDFHIFSMLLQKIAGSVPNTPQKKMFNIFSVRSGAWSRSIEESALFGLKRCLSSQHDYAWPRVADSISCSDMSNGVLLLCAGDPTSISHVFARNLNLSSLVAGPQAFAFPSEDRCFLPGWNRERYRLGTCLGKNTLL